MSEKIDRQYIRYIRYAAQWAIFALILYGGYRFYLFTGQFEQSALSRKIIVFNQSRPSLVDGFLPIGALMGLKLWIMNGTLDPVHPAAVIIFLGAIVTSIFLKKGFCGYVCPVGTASEAVYKAGAKIFGRNFMLPKYLDFPLRSVKYILMGFFLYIVLLKMPPAAIEAFLTQPYWKVADVKMLHFFTKMTRLTFYVLLGLFAVSLFVRNFWCRYLCPYGAILGLLSYLSPLKITRSEQACIHCNKCSKICPQTIDVEQKTTVRSPECTGCLSCVSACPSRGALDVHAPGIKNPLLPILHIVLVLVIFFGLIGAAKLGNKWHSNVTQAEYIELVPLADKLDHP